MTALFADTFCWIALADFNDSAHQRALTITGERAASSIVTTDGRGGSPRFLPSVPCVAPCDP